MAGGRSGEIAKMDERRTEARVDPVDLSVYLHAMRSIAEEMGTALRRTAASPNIKERRDYSCAVFDGQARVLAMGDHMPVHLGSMPMSVEAAVRANYDRGTWWS
jgi:N-methylhydantoinase B